jgi:hypothetical protein
LSTDRWRYIHYSNGDEELYDIGNDPWEWTNLANKPEHAEKLAELRGRAPQHFAPRIEASIDSLPRLKLEEGAAPASRPDGDPFDVIFLNGGKRDVELFWMTRSGERKSYGGIEGGKQKRQSTRPGAVWLVSDAKSGESIGFFRIVVYFAVTDPFLICID